jgi:hypothetical protein
VYLGVPIAPDHVSAEVAGHNQNNIRTLRNGLLLGCGERRRSQGSKQKMTAIQWHSTQYTPVARPVW